MIKELDTTIKIKDKNDFLDYFGNHTFSFSYFENGIVCFELCVPYQDGGFLRPLLFHFRVNDASFPIFITGEHLYISDMDLLYVYDLKHGDLNIQLED